MFFSPGVSAFGNKYVKTYTVTALKRSPQGTDDVCKVFLYVPSYGRITSYPIKLIQPSANCSVLEFTDCHGKIMTLILLWCFLAFIM